MPSVVLDFVSRVWCRHRANIVALLFTLISLWTNAVLGAWAHERNASNNITLPDIGFDYLPELPQSIAFTEFFITTQNVCFFVVLIFQSDREIILRRFLLLMGILYYFRGISFFVTQLPPTKQDCFPRLSYTGIEFVQAILQRAFMLVITFGFVTQQAYKFCGDYLYSGHTVITLIVHMFIQTYYFGRRRSCWFNWMLSKCHQAVTSCAILCILLSRQHYTLDIFIAYYVTTQLFWTYHSICLNPVIFRLIKKQYKRRCCDGSCHQLTMISTHSANLPCSVEHSTTPTRNFISRSWWWPLFVYLEIKHKPPRPTQSTRKSHGHQKLSNQNI